MELIVIYLSSFVLFILFGVPFFWCFVSLDDGICAQSVQTTTMGGGMNIHLTNSTKHTLRDEGKRDAYTCCVSFRSFPFVDFFDRMKNVGDNRKKK